MLQQFSWQDFLIAACVLSVVWYGGVIPILYRKELKNLFHRRRPSRQQGEPLPHRWQKDVDELPPEEPGQQQELMGAPRLPEGVETVTMDAIRFAPPASDNPDDRLGTIPDVLEEIKQAMAIIAREDGSKKDLLLLLRAIAEKYPTIAASQRLDEIRQFTIDHAPFFISEEELEDLW